MHKTHQIAHTFICYIHNFRRDIRTLIKREEGGTSCDRRGTELDEGGQTEKEARPVLAARPDRVLVQTDAHVSFVSLK